MLELLIVLAILSIALGVLLSLFTSGLHAFRAQEERSDLQQNVQNAAEFLQYEVSLAGYRGADSVANVGLRLFSSPRFKVDFVSDVMQPDTITVSYYEDRYSTATPTLKKVVYTVDPEKKTLLRAENSGAQVAVASGIRNLKVTKYLKKDGSSTDCATSTCTLDNLIGLTFQLTLSDKSSSKQNVTVTFLNPTS